MRWPRRGILIRLAIYVPLIAVFGWSAVRRCTSRAPDSVPSTEPSTDELKQKLAPHRRTIELPDGRQQEIIELTPAQAEAILGHPIPRSGGESAEPLPSTTSASPHAPSPESSSPGGHD